MLSPPVSFSIDTTICRLMVFHFFLQGLFFLMGVLCLLAAACNWNWFFTTRNAHSFYRFYTQVVRAMRRRRGFSVAPAEASRRLLRLIYAVGGVALLVLSVWFYWLTCRAFGIDPLPF